MLIRKLATCFSNFTLFICHMAPFASHLLALGLSWLALTAYAQPARSASTVSHEAAAVPQTTTSPVLTALTPRQVDNVAALGQVWGFLKYFHPAVAAGQRDWDADLLRQLPAVLACRSVAERSRVLSAWLTSLGAVPACQSCATLPAQPVRLAADLAWAQDTKRFYTHPCVSSWPLLPPIAIRVSLTT